MSEITRRHFLKTGAMALGTLALGGIEGACASASPSEQPIAKPEPSEGNTTSATSGRSQVFFTRDLSAAGLLKIYSRINSEIRGKVGIKLHTGEPNGPNLLPRELIKGLQATIPNSTLVECNVLYGSPRQTTAGHRETLKINGWDFCPVDIMDESGDAVLPIQGVQELLAKRPALYTPGQHLTEVAVGKNLLNYDSLLVYTHFKGHAMGGFGGSLKNISIGCASGQVGKQQIHGDGWPTGKLFLERMVEGGKAITDHFKEKITFINVLKNISVDCDCDGHGAKPTCRDIGILGSTDILAIDKAAIDLVYALPADERRAIVERIESRSGLHQLAYMKILGMGRDQYELVEI